MGKDSTRGSVRVTPRREWPSRLTLRRGLSEAKARPWNTRHDEASLRLIRGNSRFLAACAAELHKLGAPAVFSPPLPMTGQSAWIAAGFEPYLELALLRLDLTQPLGTAAREVVTTMDLDAAESVDADAFDEFWAMDRYGLEEALRSTKTSEILSVGEPMVGFAIIGYGSSNSYVQRIAVDPRQQGSGLGTDLLLAAAARARQRGIRSLFLNTQLDNEQSLGLYDRLGFERLEDGLFLLRTAS